MEAKSLALIFQLELIMLTWGWYFNVKLGLETPTWSREMARLWILNEFKNFKNMCFIYFLQLKELYTLLSENYVEDDDNMFRFDYSPAFLLWWVLNVESRFY